VDITLTRVYGTGTPEPHTGDSWVFGNPPNHYQGRVDDIRFFDSQLPLEQVEHLATKRAVTGPAPGTDLFVNGVDVAASVAPVTLASFILVSTEIALENSDPNVTTLWNLAVDSFDVKTDAEATSLSFTLGVESSEVTSHLDTVYLFLLGFIPPPAAVYVRSQPDNAILEIPLLINSAESKPNPDQVPTLGEVQTVYPDSFDSKSNLDSPNISFSLNTIADARVRVQIGSVSVFDPVNTSQLFTDALFSDAIPDSDF
jgi:hypothetical protein